MYPTPDTGYGTREHEDWLIEQEREDDRWGPEPIPSSIPYYDGPGCACTVRVVFGGDCAHTVEPEEDEPVADDTLGPCGCRDYHMADCPRVAPPTPAEEWDGDEDDLPF